VVSAATVAAAPGLWSPNGYATSTTGTAIAARTRAATAGISQGRFHACPAAPADGRQGSAGDCAGRRWTAVWPHVPQKLACGLTSWPQAPQNRRATSVDIGVVDIGVILQPGLIRGRALLGRASEPVLIFGCGLLMTFFVGPCRRLSPFLVRLSRRLGPC